MSSFFSLSFLFLFLVKFSSKPLVDSMWYLWKSSGIKLRAQVAVWTSAHNQEIWLGSFENIYSTMSPKALDYDSLNENVKKVQYAVRGELYLRASELQKEGKKVYILVLLDSYFSTYVGFSTFFIFFFCLYIWFSGTTSLGVCLLLFCLLFFCLMFSFP